MAESPSLCVFCPASFSGESSPINDLLKSSLRPGREGQGEGNQSLGHWREGGTADSFGLSRGPGTF
jgi:hypothetical protein